MIKKIGVLCLLPSFVFATNPCDYDSQTVSTYQGTIESLNVEKREIFPYYQETKKCKVLVQGKVQGKWYYTSQDYIFTPDMSENEACKNAINKAKDDLLKKYVPEFIESKQNLNCQVLTNPRIECTIAVSYTHLTLPTKRIV